MTDNQNKDDLQIDPDSPLGEERLAGNASASGELENLRAEKNALFEKLARAQADFTNSRKRLEADLEARVQYQLSKLIESQLPVIDNLERAIDPKNAGAGTESVLKGVQLVHDQWLDLLKRFGVELVNPKAGEAFDPHLHQAIMHEPSDVEEGTVARCVQTGYLLGGKPIRSALVVIAKAK
jgi:molecular chaperone GrpE